MLTEVNDVGEEVSEGKTGTALGQYGADAFGSRSNVTVISGGLPSRRVLRTTTKACSAVRGLESPEDRGRGGRSGSFAALKAGVDLAKPNLDELQNTLGTGDCRLKKICWRAAERLIDRGRQDGAFVARQGRRGDDGRRASLLLQKHQRRRQFDGGGGRRYGRRGGDDDGAGCASCRTSCARGSPRGRLP